MKRRREFPDLRMDFKIFDERSGVYIMKIKGLEFDKVGNILKEARKKFK